MEEWNISKKVKCLLTDNGANFRCAAKLLEASNSIEDSVRCSCHTLQLTIADAVFNNPQSSPLINLVRDLVNRIRDSPLLLSEFEKIQAVFEARERTYKPAVLVKDVVTRWNSTQAMIGSFLHKEQIIQLFLHHDSNVLPTNQQWEQLSELKTLLQPLAIATRTLEGEKYPTLGSICPVIRSVKEALSARYQFRHPEVVRLQNDPGQEINERPLENMASFCVDRMPCGPMMEATSVFG
jgi:hypothetical protein